MVLTERSPTRVAKKNLPKDELKSTTKDTENRSRSDSLPKRKRSASLESKDKRNKQVICSICNKDFKDNNDSVECECCARWFHYPCVDLTKREFQAICLLKGKSHWYCKECSAGAKLLYEDTARLRHRQTAIEKDLKKFKAEQDSCKSERDKLKIDVKEVENRLKNAEISLSKLDEQVKSDKQSIETTKQAANKAESRANENSTTLNVLKTTQEKNTDDISKVNARVDNLDKLEEKLLKKVSEVVTQLIDEKVIDPKVDEKVAKSVNDKFTSLINENDDINVKSIVNTCVSEEIKDKLAPLTDAKGDINVPQVVFSCVEEKVKSMKDNNEFPNLKDPDAEMDEVFTSASKSKELMAMVIEREEQQKRKRDLMISNLKEVTNADAERKQIHDLFIAMGLDKEIRVTDMLRLGKPNGINKRRMLKVTLETLEMKREVLSKATRLRHVPENNQFYKVFIRPNLTKKQQDDSKNLQEKLEVVKKKYPNKKFKITKGEITEVTASPNHQ